MSCRSNYDGIPRYDSRFVRKQKSAPADNCAVNYGYVYKVKQQVYKVKQHILYIPTIFCCGTMILPEITEIRKMRKALDISQKELADMAGVSQSLVAKIESGKTEPSYRNVKHLFEVLHKALQDKQPELLAGDICTRRIVSVTSDTSVSEAKKIMIEHGFSQLPVIDSGLLVGGLREISILDFIGQKRNVDLRHVRVSAIMSEPFPLVDEMAPIRLIRILLQHSPAVITMKKGKATGILTKADLLKAM